MRLDDEPFAPADEAPIRPAVLVAVGVVVLGLLAAVASLVIGGDGGGTDTTSLGAGTESTEAARTATSPAPAPATTASTAAPSTTESPSTTEAPSTSEAAATTAGEGTSETSAPTETAGPSAEPATNAAETTSPAPPATLTDGSAAPVLVVYNGASVLVDGAVPTQEAAELLEALAVANANGPAVLTSRLTVDPSVPANVGIRVIELQSIRFPSGTAEITAEHGAQFDRVADVMLALPHVTVLVVGHADQLGPEDVNLQLSLERANAVVSYLVDKGIAADRLSARGVGETDLLADDIGADTLALNRRTEFVFYGVLVPAP